MSYQRTGTPPQALLDRPETWEDVRFYLECFFLLSRFRPASGFGISPIQFADTALLARETGFTELDDMMWFVEIMSDLDMAYRDHVNSQQQNKPKTSPPSKSAVRPRRKT